jgi:hypothetical protein
MRRIAVSFVLVLVLLFLPYLVAPVHAEPTLGQIFIALGFTHVSKVGALDVTFPAGMYKIILYAEFAGYHATNELSYYEIGSSTYNLIFAGPEGGFGYISPPRERTIVADHEFGLSMFVGEQSHRYFTQNSLNPDGQIHSVVYQNLDKPGMFIVGLENLYGAGDRDYQDMVVSIEPTAPQQVVPEVPFGTIMITATMVFAMLGFAASKRHKKLQ